ncbi:acetyltransferase [Verrucomicrobia bacterium]|nr:acetyltransferase [Verrucomicrobiota bacterium]
MEKKIQKVVILGSGGYGLEALWLIEEMNHCNHLDFHWVVIGFGDDNPDRKGEIYHGHKILGPTQFVCQELDSDIYFHSAIANNVNRQRVARIMINKGFRAATLIHPTVALHHSVSIGQGTFIGAGTVVAPCAEIGDFVLINTLVGIGHHSEVKEFAQVCPGAKINGNCIVDTMAFIGSNASLQPGKKVGQGATVGANSFVVRNVEPHSMVQGVPARTLIHSKSRRS